MKRFLTIAGLIVAMVAVFVGLALWRMRSERPDLLLEKLRLGKGDKDVLKMKFNLARGDTVPLMAEAFRDENADLAFRVDMLELLFKRYNRSGDERIPPVLKEALKHSDATIRKTAVTGFDLYGSDEQRLLLIDSLDDPDAEIRRKVLVLLSSESSDRFREGDRPYDEMWSGIPEEKRLTLVGKCKEKMSAETEEELRFLARAVIGREIEFLGNKAHQAAESGDFEKGEGLLRQALALDAENHQARIRLVRHLMTAGMRDKALETAEEYGALLHIPLLAEVPAIDGDPTEEAWKSAYRYVDKPFYHTTSRWAPKQVEGKTDFYIGHRDGAVYVAVIGYEDDLSKLTVKHKERDSQCFLDDCVELFFDPDNSESEVYQFVINPIGALFDGYMTREWENMVCDWKAQVFHDRGYWSCEFAIEAKNMHGRKIAADSVWGINIARARIGPASEYCAWWPTFGWAHRYGLFPLAVFEGLGAPAGAVGKAATETQDGQLTTFRAPFNAPMDCCLSWFCGPREEPPASPDLSSHGEKKLQKKVASSGALWQLDLGETKLPQEKPPMKSQGDTKRSRSVQAEFDEEFRATASGGAVLAEKTMRSLGVRRSIKKHLPARSEDAEYSVEDAAYALMAGLLVGGQGIQAAEPLREDALLAKVFGLGKGVVSPSTAYRVLCGLAGLPERKMSDCYVASGRGLPALDMFGRARKEPAMRRVVPDVAEAATDERREALDRFTSAMAVRCVKATQRDVMRLRDWYVLFGDATDLEVDGDCFDAARPGRDGRKILRWQTLALGPILVAQQLHEGDMDEGLSMPRVLRQGGQTVRAALGAKARVLSLLDAAHFEKQVVDPLTDELHWDFIVCANQQRDVLRRLAEEQPEWAWGETGGDARRGWRTSQVCCFTHRPEGWNRPVTIVARRWIEEGQLDGVWHYSFLATRIEPGAVPKRLLEKHSYPSAIWMLYGAKQGRENHYKTPLCDFGLHHPPSCRLGVNQALYAIATAAVNVAMVMRYRVVAREERGIAFWRLRERYFRIAGWVTESARRLTVRLSGANVDALRQVLWRQAFAAAGRL